MMSETNVVGTKTMLAGSPGFQPPEQLRNESLGLPSDVYALGAVLLVLFGETPVWPALSPFQIMYKVAVCNQRPETGHLCHKYEIYVTLALHKCPHDPQPILYFRLF